MFLVMPFVYLFCFDITIMFKLIIILSEYNLSIKFCRGVQITDPLEDDSSVDEGGSIKTRKLYKEKIVKDIEVETKKDDDKMTSILYRRLSDSLHTKQKTFPAYDSINDKGDGNIDIGETCKQEVVDWNDEMKVKKEEVL